MRNKAIIGFILLALFFAGGGAHIISSHNRVIWNLEEIFKLSEATHRRTDLLNKVKLVQAHLLLAESPHVGEIHSIIIHGEAIRTAAENCVNCHHPPRVGAGFYILRDQIDDYLKKLSRVYTIRANPDRIRVAVGDAFASGEELYEMVGRMASETGHRIPGQLAETRKEIGQAKKLLQGMVIVGPLAALLVIFFFLRRFTSSISALTRATGRIREGDLAYTIAEPLPDEFGELAEAFNGMTVSLQQQREQVVAAESRYKILFESAADAIFILQADDDKRNCIVAANQAAAAMYGYAAAEMAGLHFPGLAASPDKAVETKEDFFERLLAGERVEARSEHRRQDDTVFSVEFSAGLVALRDNRFGLVFVRDITHRVQTEEALLRSRQLAVVGQMAAGLAHEIKNPLAGIKVSMEVLSNELDISQQDKEIFHRIVSEVQRIENLLRNLLNYARPPKPEFAPVDLNAQLESCLKNSEMLLKAPEHKVNGRRRVRFERHLADGLPLIRADASQVQQIFLNLLLNAIEAISDEGVVAVTSKTSEDGKVVVEVSDNGKGMTAETCARIFQPFYSNKHRGSGLGLAICKRLVELHGGEIQVVSSPGEGSTFIVAFPVHHQEQPEEAAA
ncbi:sensor histidine kinase [Desulfurivibrio alkaliphilus]|uniref:histidine kinase n=1 Tax=Desulfurivibrio alkaliphilus (strain DSM 19089 / UNIQEM U267 / AHT2) TaxID=589865 RepID=D6YZV5_DESAT|nr:ATP-binding protein [Desulfurivibrio alkaliphilus]ADH85112.1 multi-sensor signal transduction histidine kinase [Desulfurivibrio alkaliphilus AHT 2]